jgi:serine/threonine protein kinase
MLKTGESFGGFEIIGELGRGGMGVVYRARQRSLERVVALKVLAPHLAADTAFRERFRREAITAARLRHPNIVTVFEAGETDGQLFLAMELVDGTTLAHLISSRVLTPRAAVRVLTPVAHALDRAHAAELVHRDIKPQNILVGSEGDVYLADFGVAKSLDTIASATGRGHFLGSVNYASPEQISGKNVSGASDLYSLAVVLYEALTGQLPFSRESSPAAMLAHLNDTPPRASSMSAGLPAEVDVVLDKELAKEPQDRYAAAVELIDAARDALPAPEDSDDEAILVKDPVSSTKLGPWGVFGSTQTRAMPTPTTSFPEDSAPRRRRLALAIEAAIVAIAAAAVVLATGDTHRGQSVSQLLAPVDASNARLSRAIEALAPDGAIKPVKDAARAAKPIVARTRGGMSSVDGRTAQTARDALEAESTVVAELAQLSASTSVPELERSESLLERRLSTLAPHVAIASLNLGEVVTWIGDRQDERQFVADVEKILAASEPALTRLNKLKSAIEDQSVTLEDAQKVARKCSPIVPTA